MCSSDLIAAETGGTGGEGDVGIVVADLDADRVVVEQRAIDHAVLFGFSAGVVAYRIDPDRLLRCSRLAAPLELSAPAPIDELDALSGIDAANRGDTLVFSGTTPEAARSNADPFPHTRLVVAPADAAPRSFIVGHGAGPHYGPTRLAVEGDQVHAAWWDGDLRFALDCVVDVDRRRR